MHLLQFEWKKLLTKEQHRASLKVPHCLDSNDRRSRSLNLVSKGQDLDLFQKW